MYICMEVQLGMCLVVRNLTIDPSVMSPIDGKIGLVVNFANANGFGQCKRNIELSNANGFSFSCYFTLNMKLRILRFLVNYYLGYIHTYC